MGQVLRLTGALANLDRLNGEDLHDGARLRDVERDLKDAPTRRRL